MLSCARMGGVRPGSASNGKGMVMDLRYPNRVAATLVAVLAAAAPPAFAATRKPSQGRSVTLASGTLTIRFLASTYAALDDSTTGDFADTRSVTPVSPGATPRDGLFDFPVGKGARVNPTTVKGSVASAGGIEFMQDNQNPIFGSTSQFSLIDWALKLSTSPAEVTASFEGSTSASGAVLATLVTSKITHTLHHGQVTISGMTMKLTSTGAELFNDQASGFTAGETVGTASLSARS
jgi:hypothetical protein